MKIIVCLRKKRSIEYGLVYSLYSKFNGNIYKVELMFSDEFIADAIDARRIIALYLLRCKKRLKEHIERLYNETINNPA